MTKSLKTLRDEFKILGGKFPNNINPRINTGGKAVYRTSEQLEMNLVGYASHKKSQRNSTL